MPISGCGNFGIVVNPVNGDAYLMQADEDKLGLTDYKDPVIPEEPVDPENPVDPEVPTDPVNPEDPTEPNPNVPNNGEDNGGFFAPIIAFFAQIVAWAKDIVRKVLSFLKL